MSMFKKNHAVESNKPMYLAVSSNKPVVGERYQCAKSVDRGANGFGYQAMDTSVVVSVEEMGNSIYRVTTQNSIYMVQI